MISITVTDTEKFNERTGEFITVPGQTIRLEHSLVSVSKWESKWHKPFISRIDKTEDETLDYIRCMSLDDDIDPRVFLCIGNEDLKKIINYIDDPMTATWFNEKNQQKQASSGEEVTSELIYYWMTALNIPMECQHWHLNRLMTLIRVCNIKNQPEKKMSKREALQRQQALNAARRKPRKR